MINVTNSLENTKQPEQPEKQNINITETDLVQLSVRAQTPEIVIESLLLFQCMLSSWLLAALIKAAIYAFEGLDLRSLLKL